MAFRPGDVDLSAAASLAAAATTDDPRYFGYVPEDVEFPELADTAYAESMLTQYDELRAARGRTLAQEQDTTTEDVDMLMRTDTSLGTGFPSIATRTVEGTPGIASPLATDMQAAPSAGTASGTGRVSDIELMRGDRRASVRSSLLSRTRPSMSSAGIGIEDEIPAFEDSEVYGGADMSLPPLDDFESKMFRPDMEPEGEMGEGEDEMALIRARAGEEFRLSLATEEAPAVEEEPAAVKRSTARRKRRREDEDVELSSRAMKEYLNNTAPTLRRRVGDPLPSLLEGRAPMVEVPGVSEWDRDLHREILSSEELLSMPNARGLCPELREVFSMTMTLGTLPFPLSKKSRSEKSQDVESVDDVEVARERDESRRRSSLLEDVEDEIGRYTYDDASKELQGQIEKEVREEEETVDFTERMDESYIQQEGVFPQELSVSFPSLEEALLPPDGGGEPEVEGVREVSGVSVGRFKPAGESQAPVNKKNWSSRTATVYKALERKLESQDFVSFEELSSGFSRRTAASCFLEVLQLKTWGAIEATQQDPLGDIYVGFPATAEV
eukprot:CAMPEP_0185029574 /NCGR_PEP_ID=MMETSP1103-20130426/15957_1 /TAXON_ID=36769 /ORGANISM="Paraphysomonas bandaiensis, Strain Caron Lab Isolate" /LENGTH=554 /DNA_ID=CAMNT_0027564375 /DNA_START=531 /DNA_END=2195 /DNA_ORIENTATION=-